MWDQKSVEHQNFSRQQREEQAERRKLYDSLKLGTTTSIGVGLGYLGGPLIMLAGGAIGIVIGMALSLRDS